MLRALIVEDQVDVRETLRLLLSLRGWEARAAADGLEGLQLALEWRPDAVVCDIGLPGMDGWRLGKQIRESLGASVRLVALTGYGLPADYQRSKEAGFEAHLVKPADPRELINLLSPPRKDSLHPDVESGPRGLFLACRARP